MNQWIHIEHGTIHTELCAILANSIWATYKGRQPNEALATEAANNLTTAFNLIEKQLSDGREYLVGSDLSLADIYFVPYLDLIINQTSYGKILTDGRPKVQAWFERLCARPAWKKTLALSSQ